MSNRMQPVSPALSEPDLRVHHVGFRPPLPHFSLLSPSFFLFFPLFYLQHQKFLPGLVSLPFDLTSTASPRSEVATSRLLRCQTHTHKQHTPTSYTPPTTVPSPDLRFSFSTISSPSNVIATANETHHRSWTSRTWSHFASPTVARQPTPSTHLIRPQLIKYQKNSQTPKS